MKRYQLSDLNGDMRERVAEALVPGTYIHHGGLSFHPVGFRTHPEGEHVHDSYEVFVILQGRGQIELNGELEPVRAGEVLVIEPGDEHHLIGDLEHPIVNLWFHCSDERHPAQKSGGAPPVG
jgi:mannose-6-phosphate isomerase-like protein (cupin superfamily)